MLLLSSLSAFGAKISEDAAYYPSIVRNLLTNYENGEYGDEMYCFTIDGAWSSSSTILISVKDSTATVSYTESNGERIHTRELSAEECQAIVSYMADNKVDSLPDWNTYAVYDGSWYYLTHISPDGVSYVYINNSGLYHFKPDEPEFEEYYADYVETYGDDSAYVGLVKLFLYFRDNGEFELSHSSGAKILVPKEAYNVQAVWKDGDDFRVCVKTENGLEWRSFKDGAVEEAVPEPEGITLVDAWSDYPSDSWKHLNTYPWQCTWNGYRVRYSSGGLWLGSAGQNLVKLPFTDSYAYPVVIPGTDFVVCTRATNGWTALRDIVKINLVTGEEAVLDFEPVDYLKPVAMIGDELLVYREQKAYLWNPSTDEIHSVTGDFTGLSSLSYRFLQKADGENCYYTSQTNSNGKTIFGILDIEKFEFEPIAVFNGIHMTPMNMWVDEDNSVDVIIDKNVTNMSTYTANQLINILMSR